MQITIGQTTLATGAAAGQPARLISSSGTRIVEAVPLVNASTQTLLDRANRLYIDVVEVDYVYDTPLLAQAAAITLRLAALTAHGTLTYGSGPAAQTLGPALCRLAELIDWRGCGITMRYEILSTEATP